MPCYVCNPLCGKCRPPRDVPAKMQAALKDRYIVGERSKKVMDYKLVKDDSAEYWKTYEILLSADEASRRVEEIYAFFAMQAGIDYLANQDENMMKGRYDEEFNRRVSSCLANQCADKIIEIESISAALEPSIKDMTNYVKGEPFLCVVMIYVKPELLLDSYDPVDLSIPEFFVSQEMIDRNIASVIEKRSQYIDDADSQSLCKGVRAVLSLRTSKCGMEVQPLTFEDVVFEIGQGILPSEVEEHLKGMVSGETRAFSFTIASKNFLGMDVVEKMDAEATVSRFVKKETPDVSDDWVRKNIPGAHDVEGFHRLIENNVKVHAKVDYDKLKEEAACAALAARLPDLDLPNLFYDYARAGLLQNVSAALSRKGLSEEEFYLAQGVTSSQFMLQMSSRARDVVRQGLALDALAKHEGMSLAEDDLDIAARTISPGDPLKARKMLEMNGRMYQLREMALRGRARSYLVSNLIA